MGCNMSTVDEADQPVFSWDREDKLDPKDFTIADKIGGTYGRLPGEINGQQFIIENCKDSCIYLFDHSATVTICKCDNCKIYVGPSKGSVFIRNTSNCLCYVACQQFRSRECRKIEVYLLCDTQPVIEMSAGMKFGCFQLFYPEIEEQFKNAGLSVFNNLWYKIHDFTPLEHDCNWLTCDVQSRCLPDDLGDEFSSIVLSNDQTTSIVPLTRGTNHSHRFDGSCLVVFFYSTKSKCKDFLRELSKVTSYDLIQSKEIKLSPQNVSIILRDGKYSKLANDGMLVGLELNGDNIINCAKDVCTGLGIIANVFISANQESAQSDVNAFYNFVDMATA